jgi:hypothetical protein
MKVLAAGLGFWCSAMALGCSAGDFEDSVARSEFAVEGDGGECLVSEEVLEHTCQHANFGPFVSIAAQPYPGFVFADASAPHTSFDVTLPGSAGAFQGAVLFSPGADGEYAIFTTPGVPVAVFDGAGTPVVLEREGPTDAAVCAQVERAAVFHLDSTDTYTVLYGPTEHELTQSNFEFLGEGCEGCEHVHLTASRSLFPRSNVVGEVEVDHPITFEIPSAIAIGEGSACLGSAIFSFRSAADPIVHCLYLAAPQHGDFRLFGCAGGFDAGDDAEAHYFKLRVDPLSALHGPIELELELEDEACGGHEHDE